MAEWGSAAEGLDSGLKAAGFNAVGILAASSYDELVPRAWQTQVLLPGARSVLVLASGGRAFGRAYLESPQVGTGEHPVDRFTRRSVQTAVEILSSDCGAARALFYFDKQEGTFADFIALARASGLGANSRLGLLVHPEYGPWIAIRALILTGRRFEPTDPNPDFQPCIGCPAPCASACPGAAVAADGFAPRRCAETRRVRGSCQLRCDARRACVFGSSHAYDPEIEALHASASLSALGAAQPSVPDSRSDGQIELASPRG